MSSLCKLKSTINMVLAATSNSGGKKGWGGGGGGGGILRITIGPSIDVQTLLVI